MPPLPADKQQQLSDLISVLDACGAPKEILTARLRKIIAAMGLPKDAITEAKKLFTAAGFKVLNAASGPSAVTLLPPQSTINKFYSSCENLHNYMKEDKGRLDPQSGIMQQVQDPYDLLAAYIDNDLSKAASYRSSTDYNKLYASFDIIVNDCSGPRGNNYPYRSYLEMAQECLKLLNPKDGSNVKYMRYLRLEKLKQDYPFLTKLAPIPENIKLEPWFAKECLSKLQRYFSEDEAIAFYNHLAALTENPYEKESTSVTVVCSGCGTMHTFPDLKTAQAASCQCGMPLYRTCPTCDHAWPMTQSYCPECGMNMDAVREFPIHYQNAENALRASDPVRAREEYSAAKLCNPKEKQKLKALDEKITALEKTLGKPLGEIKSLIASKHINAASRAIAAMNRDFPTVDLSVFSEEVAKELKWASRETEKLTKKLPEKDAVQLCIQVLQRVADDPIATMELRNHPPRPVLNLIVSTPSSDKSCSISWTPDPGDVDITYTVVRKDSGSAPAHINDGKIICQGIGSTSIRDTGLKPGVNYHYSVFACRGTVESKPVSTVTPILLLQPLSGFEASGTDGKCMLSWHQPEGCQGVRILRDGKVLVQCVTSGTYVDEDVEDGDEITYTLQTVWRVGAVTRYSTGIDKDVSIEATPEPVTIKGSIDSGVCRITWEVPKQSRSLVLLKPFSNQKIPPNTVYSFSRLKQMGDVLKIVPSTAGRVTWGVPDNTHLQVVAMTRFGDSVISSNTISLTNVEGCKIDEDKTCIQNQRLVLHLLSVPKKATRIAYLVSTERFAGIHEASFLNSVDKNNWSMITGHTNNKDLFVTLFAVYEENGTKIFSQPTTYLVPAAGKAAIRYQIVWGGFLHNNRNNATLQITVDGASHIPDMTLCGSKSGKPIIGNFNTDLVTICHIPAQKGNRCSIKLDSTALQLIPSKAELKLMLNQPSGARYTLPEALKNSNIVP